VGLHEAGRLTEASEGIQLAIRLAREQGRHPVEIAALHNRLAGVHLETGELELSRLDLRRAEALLAGQTEQGREESIVCLTQQSMLHFHQRRFAQAVDAATAALAARDRAPGVPSRQHAEIHQQLAVCLHGAHRVDEAMTHFRHAQEHCQAEGACPAPLNGTISSGLGLLLAQSGQPEEGLRQLAEAIRLFELSQAAPVLRLRPMNNLAVLLMRRRQAREAQRLLEQALDFAGQALGDGHPLTATLQLNRSAALRLLGRKREARQARLAAEQAMTEWMRRNGLQHSVDYSDLLSADGASSGPTD
jgi:tetratricopeptide (TPR) repeat protein